MPTERVLLSVRINRRRRNDEEYDNSDKVDDGNARPFAGRVRQGIRRHGATGRAEGNRCFGSRHRICTET